MPEVIRGTAAVAGTDNTRNCKPAQPVSVLHIYALNDTHVLYEGGAGPDSVNKALVTDYRSAPATIAQWVQRNDCQGAPQRILQNDGASCDVYASCRGGTQVPLCVTGASGHSWPGGMKTRSELPSRALITSETMWEFFTRVKPR